MPTLTFISSAGDTSVLSFEGTTTAMQVARVHRVPGIEAECGGALSCGTCHVYVDEVDRARIPSASIQESEMLDLVAAERRSTSRLCCQIQLSDATDGLVLHIPSNQF